MPFYDWFCRVTGFCGVTQTADAAGHEILDQTIKIKFDASKSRGMPWEFKPMQTEMTVRIGEDGPGLLRGIQPDGPPRRWPGQL